MLRHLLGRSAPRFVWLMLLATVALAGCGRGNQLELPQDGATSGAGQGVSENEVRGETTFAYLPPPEGAEPVRGGTVVLPLLSDIDGLNPFVSSTLEAQLIQDMIFPRLMEEQPDYYKGPPTFTPVIAESWEFGEDGLSIRFRLRECTWSDGAPITAEDVRFSWQAAKNPDVAWVSASIVDFISDVEIHGPRDFTVHYIEQSPYQLMDINDLMVIPRHSFGKIPFEQWQTHGVWTAEARVAGAPWMLDEYIPNQQITLTRNPSYWDEGKPYLDKVVFRIIPDQRTQMTALLAGDIDAMPRISPKDAGRVLNSGRLNLFTYVDRLYIDLEWNCGRAPFDDARVRRAMAHAVNRENIVEAVYYGYAKVGAAQIISSLWASNEKLAPYPYDPAKAAELLTEAGWSKNSGGVWEKGGQPLRFTLITNAGNSSREQICQFVESDLKKLGVEVDIRLMDFNQMIQQLRKHDFDAAVFGLGVATKVDLKNIWHSSAANGRFNNMDYANDRVDEIIDTARTMSDFQAAKPLWDELQEILYRDQPTTMVVEPRGLVVFSKRLTNVRVTSLRYFDNVEEWWILPDQPAP